MGDPATELIRLAEDRKVDPLRCPRTGIASSTICCGTTVNKVRHVVKVPVLLLRAQ
jgi:hypothetical protein